MKIFTRSSLYKFIYIGIILTFLFMFYTRKEVSSYNANGLQVIETSSIDYPLLPKRIKSLDITYKGLSFFISPTFPATIVSDDDVIRNSRVVAIHSNDKRLLLTLENSIELIIRVDNGGNRLTINCNIPKVFPTIKEIIIPYTLKDTYALEESDLSYKISNTSDEFHLKRNDLYFMDPIKSKIHLISNEDKIATLTFSPLSGNDLPIAEQWYMNRDTDGIKSIEQLSKDYIAASVKKINGIFNYMRFNSEQELWQNTPSLSSFSEDSTIIYLAEGMKNGTISNRLSKIKEVKRRYPTQFSHKSSLYLGDIVVNGKKEAIFYEKNLSDLKKILNNSEPILFETWIPKDYFIGKEINLIRLEKRIAEVDKESLTLKGLVYSLNNLINIVSSGTISSTVSDNIKEISDLIIKRIEWDENGLFLTDENISDMALNLTAGQLLIETSQFESSKYSKPIGEALISTYLESSNNNGEISKTYDLENGLFSANKITTEESYLKLTDNKYLPHYYQEDNIRIWTVSDSVDISGSSINTRITITYPVNNNSAVNTQYLTISGIRPYKQIYFKGKPWRADRSFEKWGVGYYYDQNSELLYFMPNHTKSREEILISY